MIKISLFFALICAAAVLLFGTADVQATEATIVADRAGFLLGHAQRCGVDEDQLLRAKAFMDQLISAFSADDEDHDAAKTQFTQSILAGALAELLGEQLPSCPEVTTQLTELERHRPQTFNDRRKQVAQRHQPSAASEPSRFAIPAKPAGLKKPSTSLSLSLR